MSKVVRVSAHGTRGQASIAGALVPAVLVTAVLATLSFPAASTPICRWVDDSGRTQMAEVAPDRYKTLATCTDSQQYELSPAQRRAAEQAAAEDRARAARAAASLPARSAASAPRPASGASQAQAKRPTQVVTDATDCPTWWRLYEESGECFGPFRTTRGAIKAEAFDVCNEIPSPEPKCGPRSN
jgi:hypothetical protein